MRTMLDANQKQRLVQLFADGSELPSAERAAFVARACADDAVVQVELAELLEVESEQLAAFLAEPAVAVAADESAMAGLGPVREAPLPRIDGYDEFEPIAEGGMGTVYKARQLRPVRRAVAIKLIRAGMDSSSVLARFAAEREALARMNHPFVAAVHDAGTDALGRPFLVMEFVDGVPITDFCARERLSLEDRLRLFVGVCRAVDHAHRRGVLHRDLKPSNVLVAKSNDGPRPKVIDFGIAKALEGALGEQSIHTLAGTFLGTPEYMAPEQIDGVVDQVDTRSDVYSLGVMLYELLTRARPLETDRATQKSVVHWSRFVRDTVPTKPSTRLRQLQGAGADSSPVDGEPARWLRCLSGDLDWVVMKALEKEPDRRYGSARELAEDLENFLAHRPVTAGPPSGVYRLRKFVRRYRVQVAAFLLVLLSLVLGLSSTIWFLVESRANEQDAIERATEAEGVRIAAEAALVAKDDPNLALLLALEASERTDDSSVRRSIHEALPQHAMLQRLCGHDHGIEQGAGVLVHYLRDGRLLGSGASDAVLWDAETGTQLRRFAGPRASIDAMVVDPGERLLLAASQDGSAWLWDLETGACLRVVEDHDDEVVSCAFAPDGRRFATASRDGTARVFALDGAGEPLVLQHGAPVGPIAFADDGTRLATFAEDGCSRVWDSRTGVLEVTCEPRTLGPMTRAMLRGCELFFSPRIDRIVSHSGGTLRVHTTKGEQVAEIAAMFPRRLGDDRLLASFAGEGRLGVVDLRTGAVQRHEELRLWSAMPTPDGRRAVAIDHNRNVCLLDLATMRVVRRYLGPADKVNRPPIAFHPDGKRFAVLAENLLVWSFEPDYGPFDLPGVVPSTHEAAHVAWSTARLAAIQSRENGLADGRWQVWDAIARARVGEIHRPDLALVVPAPDGSVLIGAVPERDGRGPAAVVFERDGRVRREIGLPPIPRLSPDVPNLLDWCVDPTGRLLVTATHPVGHPPEPREGAMLRCHDLATGALLAEIPRRGGVPVSVGGPQSALVVMAGWHQRWFEVVDWRTGAVKARVSRPPDGMHLEGAISPDGRYLLGTVGEPLAFVWDLEGGNADANREPIVAYTGLTPAGAYPCGFLAGGRLCWVVCADEVHVFETATGRLFSLLRLRDSCAGVAESADGAELLTLTGTGRVQRWPLDPEAMARRRAVGRLDSKQRAQYRIGTPTEQRAAERAWLAANASPGNYARLGRMALDDGDLDAAIACYQRGADLGVLGPYYQYLYVDLLSLYCRRLGANGSTDALRTADLAAAFAALERALRCGAVRDRILAVPGVEALRGDPRFAALLGG